MVTSIDIVTDLQRHPTCNELFTFIHNFNNFFLLVLENTIMGIMIDFEFVRLKLEIQHNLG